MNNYEDWANLVAKKLKGEADVISAIDKDELDDGVATEVFVRTVLKPFLPENFGIGAGRIVDAFGNRSEYFDIVIYNRSFPRIGLRGTQSDYLYESVLAAFAIRAKYVRKTFFESMDACASMARLVTNVDKSVLVKLARRNGLKPGPNKSFVHEDSVRTARFELIGSPPVFMFGFTGIKNSYRQLEENIQLWIEHQKQDNEDLPMRAFPAVIATQGCFAWRNAAPLALSNREMMGVGNDHAPVRLIVLQLLYLLNRGLNVISDGYGLKPNLSAYLSQFSAPKFEHGVGNVDQLISLKIANKDHSAADESKRLQSARDHSAPEAAVNETTTSKPAAKSVQQAAASAAAMSKPAPAVEEPVSPPKSEAEKAESGTSSGVFDKPSPFASAPAPAASSAEKAESGTSPGVFDKPSPFASAPAPAASSAEKAEEPARFKPPTAALGSAPIPGIANPADKETPARLPVAAVDSASIPMSDSILNDDSIPPLPPIDIELTDTFPMPEEMPEDVPEDLPDLLPDNLTSELPDDELEDIETSIEPDFEATMVTAPDASPSTNQPGSSTEAFIERVKGQLSDSSAKPEKDEEPFISTIPV